MQGQQETTVKWAGAGYFLPDFCAVRSIFVLVVSAELLAFLLVLATLGRDGDPWSQLGLVSLFVQWVALSCAALLCLLRPWLRRVPTAWVAVISFTLVLAMTTLCTAVAVGVLDDPGRSWSSAAHEVALTLGRNLAIAGIVAVAVLRYLYVQQQWKHRLQSEAQARIQALQARIRPHFLFNSLNTIASLTRSDAAQAERALEDLSDLFRASLQEASTEVTLGEELELCRRYLALEQLRLGERLQVRWAVATLPQKALVPALSLQPLVENAVYHGVQPRPEGGRVSVSGICEQGRIAVLIRNPVPPDGARQHREGNRLAQDNVRQRLQALYGGSAQLEVRREAGWYEVRVSWPVRLAD